MAGQSSQTNGLGAFVSSPNAFTGAFVRFTNQRLVRRFANRFCNRQIGFTLAAIPVLVAKFVHVYAHLPALGATKALCWGLTFITQDILLLLLLRFLLDDQLFTKRPIPRILATILATLGIVYCLFLGSVNVSFYVVTGGEVHWRNMNVVEGKSSIKVALSGLVSLLFTEGAFFASAWILQDLFYNVATLFLDVFKAPFGYIFGKLYSLTGRQNRYAPVPQPDDDERFSFDSMDEKRPNTSKLYSGVYYLVGIFLLVQVLLYCIRPSERPLIFMSWTLPLLPIVDLTNAQPNLQYLLPYYGNSINRDWDNRTALAEPVTFPWLPQEKSVPGFEDWYGPNKTHYRASRDPLRISNLEEELLPTLRDAMANISIRHIVLMKLESNRKDVFPFKKDGLIAERFASSYANKTLPPLVSERLSNLTPTANFITGDYNDGFEHAEKPRRGGINCNNAFTTASYTLKSMTGTLCGVSPLVEDFNVEYQNHMYQPCLPQIFDVFNGLDRANQSGKNDFTSFPWRSSFMQSTTQTYDKQDKQMPFFGYAQENLISKEYIQSEEARFGPVDLPDVNYYGPAEVAIEDYIRSAFVDAKKDNERVFLTHLTSTTHHPFGVPKEYETMDFTGHKDLGELNRYTNAIGYVDTWLKKVLDILDEEGVANETLVVFVGDHGLSVAEDDTVTPYHAPNIGNFHVPLVISHPSLPPIDIETPVESLQILPTVLDLLRSTKSLGTGADQAASDLLSNYEGQSLIRPLQTKSKSTGHADWQFTIMNPGRSQLSVRSTNHPEWRLCLPMVRDIEWRFTNLGNDPHEKRPLTSWSIITLMMTIEDREGIEAAKWIEEAAFMARWWVAENRKRYHYVPKA